MCIFSFIVLLSATLSNQYTSIQSRRHRRYQRYHRRLNIGKKVYYYYTRRKEAARQYNTCSDLLPVKWPNIFVHTYIHTCMYVTNLMSLVFTIPAQSIIIKAMAFLKKTSLVQDRNLPYEFEIDRCSASLIDWTVVSRSRPLPYILELS